MYTGKQKTSLQVTDPTSNTQDVSGIVFAGTSSIAVQDTSTVDGTTIPEMLFQILIQLKLLNVQINQLPEMINNCNNKRIDIDTLLQEITS